MNKELKVFAQELHRIIPEMLREMVRRQENELAKGRITMPQMLILEYLRKTGESNMTELADYMHVSTAAMTGIIERILKYGYLKRIYSQKDRRIIMIKLTPKGKKVIAKIDKQRTKMILNTFGKITKKERQDYLRILKRIHNVVINSKKRVSK